MNAYAYVTNFALLASALSACSTYGAEGGVYAEACAVHASRQVVYADESFTPDERADIINEAAHWSTLSNTRITIAVVFTSHAPAGARRLWRSTSTNPAIIAAERRAGFDGITRYFSAVTTEAGIVLAMDRIDRSQFANVIRHEQGHFAGLRPYACTGTDCTHSPDPDATMCGWPRAASCNGVNQLTQADLAFCQASCLCDSP